MTPEMNRRAEELGDAWRVRTMRAASLGLFVGTPVALFIEVLRFPIADRQLYASLFLVGASFYLGWFLHRRVQGKEAAIGAVRISPETPWESRVAVEWGAVLAALVFLVLCGVNALFGGWHG
jgi:hypothetical protein